MPTPLSADAVLGMVVPPVDEILDAALAQRLEVAAAIDPRAAEPVREIARLVHAGGKRIRPAFCVWGHRAAGGDPADAGIWQVAAAIELLHTMALIHDDVMDDDEQRRGEPTVHARARDEAARRRIADPTRVGIGVAIVAGDVAAAIAESLFAAAAFPSDRHAAAAARFEHMRLELGMGAYLDIAEPDADPRHVAYLKGGAYTAEAPLLIGSALAGGSSDAEAALVAYARPLGLAFQLLDDLADGDAPADASRAEAEALLDEARSALGGGPLEPTAAEALRGLADLVGSL